MYEGKIFLRHVWYGHIDGQDCMYEYSLCNKLVDSCMIAIACMAVDYCSNKHAHSSIYVHVMSQEHTWLYKPTNAFLPFLLIFHYPGHLSMNALSIVNLIQQL
jgi:hypothetical protein